MTNRETALQNALNRTTSFHEIPVNANKDTYKSLLVLNPHSYFKVIINGHTDAEKTKEFTAVLDILNGDIFTVNFRGSADTIIKFKIGEIENKGQILFVNGIYSIQTLTLEYFDYFEMDTTIEIPKDMNFIFNNDDKDKNNGFSSFSGINIYQLKPLTTSSLSIRNALAMDRITAKDIINVKTIKFGPWEFSVTGGEISTNINSANIADIVYEETSDE